MEVLELILDSTQFCSNIIAITERVIINNKFPVNGINLTSYSYEYCPTELSAGGILLYTGNRRSYRPRYDLYIYEGVALDSTFIELLNTKKSNVIICAIYRHPNLDEDDFKNSFPNPLIHKISKESISIFLLGDFNADPLKYNHHAQ